MSGTVLDISPIGNTASLSTRIYEQLKAAISNMNIYDPGVELRMDERGLSEQFGISRTPLREALHRLDQEGLVSIVPRRGIYIVRKSKREILEMITVWAALEGMAARLACQVASDEALAGLHDLVDGYDAAGAGDVSGNKPGIEGYMAEYSDANIRFHSSIVRLSGCALIAEVTDGLFIHVRAIRNRTIHENNRARDSVRDHARIVAALEQRDADLASRLVREHTMQLHAHVERHVGLD